MCKTQEKNTHTMMPGIKARDLLGQIQRNKLPWFSLQRGAGFAEEQSVGETFASFDVTILTLHQTDRLRA